MLAERLKSVNGATDNGLVVGSDEVKGGATKMLLPSSGKHK